MANEDLGALRVSLGLSDSNFTGNIPKINRQLRLMDSEFKAASSSVDGFEDSLSKLESQSTNIEKKLQLQRVKVDELKRQYDELVRTKGADSKAAENMLIRYNKTVAAMNKTEQSLRNVNKEIQEQSSEWNRVSKEADQALSKISNELAAVKSEFKSATAGIENFGSETMDLRQKSEHLERVLGLENQAVEQLNRKYQEAVRAKGRDAEETQQLLVQYNNAKARAKETEAEMNRLNHTINEQSSRIGILRRRAKDAQQSLDDFGNSAQSMGTGIATTFGVATAAIGTGLGLATKKSMDFEAQLSSIKALTGASGDEMAKMRDLAMKMGSQTKYSSLEAAEGIEELLKAGLTPAQVQADGLKQSLSLATAGGLDLAKASEIMSTALNTFKKDGMSAADASNILAGSANASATSVEELQYGLAAVGTVADGTGFSFRDTAAALGVFANNGLRGSDAGTSLKTMLANLQPQTKAQVGMFMDLGLMTEYGSNAFFDAAGNVKSMAEVAGILQKALKDQTNEQRQNTLHTLFGSDAIRAGNILYKEGAEGIRNFKSAMGNVTAEEVATEKMNNLKGDIEQLKGSFETLQISIGKNIEPMVKLGVDGVQKLVDGFNNLSPGMQKTITYSLVAAGGIAAIATAGGLLLSFLGTASIGLGAVTGLLGTFGIGAGVAAGGAAAAGTAAAGAAGGVGLLGGALTLLTGPVGIAIAAIAGIGIAAYAVDKALDKPIVKSDIFGNKVSAGTKKAVGAYMDLEKKATENLNKLYFNQETMTDAAMRKSEAQYKAMGEKIKGAIDRNYNSQINQSKKYFADSNALTEKEENAIIKKLQSKQAQKKKDIDNYEKQIHKIEKGAADERRSLNDEEYRKIDAIKKKMRESAVKNLSQSEKDQKTILGRLKNESAKLSTEQASAILQQSAKARDGSIKDANTTYNKKVKWIREQRDVLGTMSKEEANKLLKEAKRQKDGSIKDANEMYRKVVENAKKQSKGHISEIDLETGKIKSGWQKMNDAVEKSVNWLNKIFGVNSSKTAKAPNVHSVGDNSGSLKINAGGRATGTPNGGIPTDEIALTGEEGPELHLDGKTGKLGILGAKGPEVRYLSKGSSVLPAHMTKSVLQQYGFGNSLPAYAEGVGIENFDDIMKGPKFLWDKAVSKFGLSDNLIPNWINKITGSPLKYIAGLAEKKVKSMIDDWGFGGGDAPNIKGGASAWRGQILKAAAAMKEAVTPAQVNGIIAQIQRESGGNQRIVQSSAVRDINTRNGNPARGLLQYIPQTFRAYAVKGHNNIYSGYDQLLAFFNNTSWRKNLPYGKRGWGPTGARKYEQGGIATHPQFATLAENGYPEWIIPSEPKFRNRALALWEEVGQKIGAFNTVPSMPDVSNSIVSSSKNGGSSNPANENNYAITNNYELKFVLPENATQYMQDPRKFAVEVKKHLEELDRMEKRYGGIIVQ